MFSGTLFLKNNLRRLIRPFGFPFSEEYFCKHLQIDLWLQYPNLLEIVESYHEFQDTLRQFCYLKFQSIIVIPAVVSHKVDDNLPKVADDVSQQDQSSVILDKTTGTFDCVSIWEIETLESKTKLFVHLAFS